MCKMLRTIIFFVLIIFIIPIGCSGGKMSDQSVAVKYEKISNVPDAAWQKLSAKRIFFGHQSVGYNIVAGLQDIVNENSKISLGFKETFDPNSYEPGVISHYRIGYNEDPRSKLDMFAFLARAGGAEKADIMFFKFCYVDFNSATDVQFLFDSYKAAFKELKTQFPNTTFIHCTVPLTTIQTGPKAWIKGVLGRPAAGIVENAKRHDFNEMLRQTYSGKEPVFDIAAAESTFLDGKRAVYEFNGSQYYYLIPDYASDGAHLNEQGRKVVATKLLLLLAEVSS